jgi:hypothetical protein
MTCVFYRPLQISSLLWSFYTACLSLDPFLNFYSPLHVVSSPALMAPGANSIQPSPASTPYSTQISAAQSLRPCWVMFFEKKLRFLRVERVSSYQVAPIVFVFIKADNGYRVSMYVFNIMGLLNVIHGFSPHTTTTELSYWGWQTPVIS